MNSVTRPSVRHAWHLVGSGIRRCCRVTVCLPRVRARVHPLRMRCSQGFLTPARRRRPEPKQVLPAFGMTRLPVNHRQCKLEETSHAVTKAPWSELCSGQRAPADASASPAQRPAPGTAPLAKQAESPIVDLDEAVRGPEPEALAQVDDANNLLGGRATNRTILAAKARGKGGAPLSVTMGNGNVVIRNLPKMPGRSPNGPNVPFRCA